MDKIEKQYSDRIEYENIQRRKTKSLDYLLPEWIMNLKNYFERKPDNDDSPAYKSI